MIFYKINILHNTDEFLDWFKINFRRDTLIILLCFSTMACTTTPDAETASVVTPVSQPIIPLQMTHQETQTVEQPISSVQIEWAQSNLDLLGYEVGEFNQGLTPETQAALADFQKQSGLPETGALTSATLQALEQAVKNLSTQPERETVHLRPPVALERETRPTTTVIQNPVSPPQAKTFTDIKTMGIYRVAAPLAEIGYFYRPLKQATLETVEMALKRFQQDIGVAQTGILDETTWTILQGIQVSRARKTELEAAIAVAQAKPSQSQSSPTSQANAHELVMTDKRETVVMQPPSPPVSTIPSIKDADSAKPTLTLKTGDSVYAIDKIECQGAHEAFVLYYQGELQNILKDKVQIRITKRYAMWYDAHKTGISDTDWWCIPKKRFCYSTINFADWRGKFKPNDIGDFETRLTIQSDFDITSFIAKSSKQACSF